MHISLTPELEKIVKQKVESGLYNNASEVVREALRFMEQSEDLVHQMKLEHLRAHLAQGEAQIARGEGLTLRTEADVKRFLAGMMTETVAGG
jgi:antitoxin ParD1/3/4